MDRSERIHDPEDAIRQAMFNWQSELWTALPGYVISFDPVEITASIQTTYLFTRLKKDGTTENVKMTPLIHCPVYAPRGGGATLTFPVRSGDEVLVIFACRCIDGWWRDGGVQLPTEFRMHDLSDGFALIGPFSQAQKISGWNTQAVELRTDDGSALVQVDPTSHQLTLRTMTTVLVDAPMAHMTGNLQVDGDIVVGGEVTAESGGNHVTMSAHVHQNTQPGIGTSGPPFPGI